MIQSTFVFDLFDTERGTLTVHYNIFDTHSESIYCRAEQARKLIEARVRNLICDRIDRMRRQREQNYRYGETWNVKQANALLALPGKLATARALVDIVKFAEYVKTEIYPLLYAIAPGDNSRFRKGYSATGSQLRAYINGILTNPEFANVIQPAKFGRHLAR